MSSNSLRYVPPDNRFLLRRQRLWSKVIGLAKRKEIIQVPPFCVNCWTFFLVYLLLVGTRQAERLSLSLTQNHAQAFSFRCNQTALQPIDHNQFYQLGNLNKQSLSILPNELKLKFSSKPAACFHYLFPLPLTIVMGSAALQYLKEVLIKLAGLQCFL